MNAEFTQANGLHTTLLVLFLLLPNASQRGSTIGDKLLLQTVLIFEIIRWS